MAQIITFVFFLGINTVISNPIYGNLYEEQALHERIEQLAAIHEVPALQEHIEQLSAIHEVLLYMYLYTHGNRSSDIAKLHCNFEASGKCNNEME